MRKGKLYTAPYLHILRFMILRHDRRTVPQLNTTSTADISFILLVFFLIMTSMDVDKGLTRMLPPMNDENRQEMSDIEKRNVLSIRIMPEGNITVNGKQISIDKLRLETTVFITQSKGNPNRTIMLEFDRHAPYESYFNVQNEIAAAYNTVRNNHAIKKHGRAYNLCTPEEREVIRALYPQRITETTIDSTTGKGGMQ